MYTGIRGVVLLDELSLLVDLDMVLVTIVVLTAFLRPSGIDVLVAALVGLVLLPFLGVAFLGLPEGCSIAGLDLLVLLTGVALAGRLHESSIDDLAFVEGQAKRIEVSPELVKQKVECSSLTQLVTACSHSLLVRNLSHGVYAKKLAETGPVDYLVLYLVVA